MNTAALGISGRSFLMVYNKCYGTSTAIHHDLYTEYTNFITSDGEDRVPRFPGTNTHRHTNEAQTLNIKDGVLYEQRNIYFH